MMYYLVILEKGSDIQKTTKTFRQRGGAGEIIATPMKIAKNGCGKAIKIKMEDFTLLKNIIMEYNILIKDVYRIRNNDLHPDYEHL